MNSQEGQRELDCTKPLTSHLKMNSSKQQSRKRINDDISDKDPVPISEKIMRVVNPMPNLPEVTLMSHLN